LHSSKNLFNDSRNLLHYSAVYRPRCFRRYQLCICTRLGVYFRVVVQERIRFCVLVPRAASLRRHADAGIGIY